MLKVALAFSLIGLAGPHVSASEPDCKVLDDEIRDKVIRHVSDRFRLPDTARIQISEVVPVSDCYLRFRIRASNERQVIFDVNALLSPDRRFILREAYDITENSLLAIESRRNEILRKLKQGRSAVFGGSGSGVNSLTIFGDFQCPACRYAGEVLKEAMKETTIRLEIRYRYLPLDFHQWAYLAATVAECARIQSRDAFWKVHDLFSDMRNNDLTSASVLSQARAHLVIMPEFDAKKFDSCIDNGESRPAIDEDIALARDLAVEGTPTVYLNGERLQSLVSVEQLKTLVRQTEGER